MNVLNDLNLNLYVSEHTLTQIGVSHNMQPHFEVNYYQEVRAMMMMMVVVLIITTKMNA